MSFLKKKLTKFGIEGRMLGWIQDFLDGRKIRVRVADEHSEYVGYENGSPEGSVLSSILFNITMNTLHDELKELPME